MVSVRMMEAREGIATDWEKPKTMATEAGENRRRTSALTAKRKDARTARKGQRDSTDEEHETEGEKERSWQEREHLKLAKEGSIQFG